MGALFALDRVRIQPVCAEGGAWFHVGLLHLRYIVPLAALFFALDRVGEPQ